ncbi:hypothetical protein GOP47_0010733 [Adiantum capillus-veneris]|uniref:Uncharacterized protein n=1 Tax=Adiantum capillus-veneris TaxID=13818 RepID=A0A9D4UWL7_ADICA|nr:hypothetical protein GOP47_0010733 [Adiantum capillus-veneris]
MTNMVSTLGGKQVPQFVHVSELPQNTLSCNQHVKPLLQCPKLWLSYISVCRKNYVLPFDGLRSMTRQKRGSSVAFAASCVKEDTLITVPTSLEESSFKLAAENAYMSPSAEPSVGSFLEPTTLKPLASRRMVFPANDASVPIGGSNSLSGADLFLTASNGNCTLEYDNGPPPAVVMCLECLELTDKHFRKCLKHASSVSEEEVIGLLKTLSSHGFHRRDIKAIFSKYPSLVKVHGSQVAQWFQCFYGAGFQKNDVISLLLKRPAVVACELKRARQVIDFFVSIGTSKEDLIAMIACRPHVIQHDVEVVERIVLALMKAGLDKPDISRLIKKAPTVFTVSLENLEKSLLFWSKVGIEGKALCRAILRRPNLLNYSTEKILSYDPETKLKPLIDYFLELGLNEKEVAKVIHRRPQIMSCTAERLKKVAEFLIGLGLKDYMVGKVLVASPQVFTLNTENKLQRGVEFFQSVGLDKERHMEIVFTRCAQLFCCSIENNLLPTFEFLSNIGLEKESLSKMIAGFPSMLGHNAELSLAPKYEFLIGEMKRTNKELVEFPQYFGYSLEGRIKPRHKLLAERGLSKSLPSMLACTDIDFYKRYVEPYSPLPQALACDAAQQQQKPRERKVLTPPHVGQSKAIQQERSPSPVEGQPEPSQKETLSVDHRREVLAAECPVHDNWDFLDMIPKLHEQQVYFTLILWK